MKEFKKNHKTLIAVSTILLIVVACGKVCCCLSRKCKEKGETEE